MTEQVDGQMSLFDQDIWSSKMSQVYSAATLTTTTEETSELCLRKSQESKIKMPLFLDLTQRTDDGLQADVSWVEGGPLLGEYMMHSFGEYPNEENASHLSQILEAIPHRKYSLSAKACEGILRRASNRGKELPQMLKDALVQQIERSKHE